VEEKGRSRLFTTISVVGGAWLVLLVFVWRERELERSRANAQPVQTPAVQVEQASEPRLLVASARPESHPPNTSPSVATGPKVANRIQGEWVVTKLELFGTVQDKADISGEMEFGDDHLIMKSKNKTGRLDVSRFNIQLTPDKTPCEIELFTDDKRTILMLGIYKIEGDELVLCWRPIQFTRPETFKTSREDQGTMFTLKRKK
jgi:uncharacterized protein (TIGR03067 family)